MGSREVSVWIDERWYDALRKQLKNETLEERLEDVLDEMCGQLPEQVQERISREIWEERQRDRELQEASKQYAVFHVTEHGREEYLLVDRGLEFLDTARLLRRYLRNERGAGTFRQMLFDAKDIPAETFEGMAHFRMENTGKVTGAFELDFDEQQIAALNIMEGWVVYRMQDVSTAVYHADRKQFNSNEETWRRFLDRLAGKEVTDVGLPMELSEQDRYLSGCRAFTADEIKFADEIMSHGRKLSFYMPVCFDKEAVFGSPVVPQGADDYIHVYAAYDLEDQCVSQDLEIIVFRGDGSEEEFRYRLSEAEQELFLRKMDAYCTESGMRLAECRE